MSKLILFTVLFSITQNVFADDFDKLEVMVYNVENLFDARHDIEGGVEKNDWTFLPKKTPGKDAACKKISYWKYKNECFNTDWSQELVDLKISQIKEVLTKERKSLPNILALVEIENSNVVGMLAKALGYKQFKVSQSPDKRGIDLAVLYNSSKKLTFVKKSELVIEGDYFKKKPTRVILEIEFLVNKKPLHFFVNHWPSQGNPSATRIAAAKKLKQRIEKINKSHYIMAVGDFNTIPSDMPHPFHNVILKEELLKDVHNLFSKDRSIDKKLKKNMPPGTYFYSKTMSWNILDRIFVSKNLMDGEGFDAILSSYEIYAPDFITKSYEYKKGSGYLSGSKVNRVPNRYDHSETSAGKAGYSDHFPVVLRFNL
jgi:hypothetical protein